jgi:hypothetical protein
MTAAYKKGTVETADFLFDTQTGAMLVKSAPVTTFAGNTKTVSPAAAASLVAASTPCQAVWIGARMNNDGTPTNTNPVFIGDVTNQTMALAKDDFKGFLIPIADAFTIYIRPVTAGEGVAYRILT